MFFHKNLDPKSTPDWVRTHTIEHTSGPNVYPLVNDAATLVWLAQLASLEIHVPQWRVGDDGLPEHPIRLVLDLDPGEADQVERQQGGLGHPAVGHVDQHGASRFSAKVYSDCVFCHVSFSNTFVID